MKFLHTSLRIAQCFYAGKGCETWVMQNGKSGIVLCELESKLQRLVALLVQTVRLRNRPLFLIYLHPLPFNIVLLFLCLCFTLYYILHMWYSSSVCVLQIVCLLHSLTTKGGQATVWQNYICLRPWCPNDGASSPLTSEQQKLSFLWQTDNSKLL